MLSQMPLIISVSAISDCNADRVDIELQELAKAAGPWFIGAPHRADCVSTKRLWQFLVLSDDASERNGVIEPQAELFLFGILNHEDGLLNFLAAGAGQHVKIFDRGSGQRNEPVEFVDASHHVDHVLTGQGVFRKKVPQPT